MNRPTATEIAAREARQLTEYGYVSRSGMIYALTRDGVEVTRGDEAHCWRWIQNHCPYSVSHAVKYEGYRFVEALETEKTS